MGADGSSPVNLTNDPAGEFLPDWQPLAAAPATTAPATTAPPTSTPVVTATAPPSATPVVTETALTTAVLAGATEIDVDVESIFALGDTGIISAGTASAEAFTVAGFGSLLLESPLQFDHEAGAPVALATGDERTWGDHNCSGSAGPVDALLTLRFDAGLSTNVGDCPNFGQVVEVAFASPHPWGDVDCGGGITPVDALKLLRFDAALSVSQADGCPLIGSQVLVTE